MPSYEIFTLRDNQHPGTAALTQWCHQIKLESGTVFGVFPALFGLASNELYLVTAADAPVSLPAMPDGVAIAGKVTLTPTVRPTDHSPRSKEGIYVFRWFEVNPADIDEIVRLSDEAWRNFEGDFDTEIQGLFKGVDVPSRMLLLTWYRNLAVWEASRNPAPAARENFLKRHRMTRFALPVCTRLAGQDAAPALISET